MDRVGLEKILDRLPGLRTLVLGDLMVDEYLWGRTERISPEAPVQVVDVIREDLRLGGAGNVVNNLLALGCQVTVASVLGEDQDGLWLRRRLAEKGLSDEGVLSAPDRTTSRKTRILSSNQQMLRIDRESRDPIKEEIGAALVDFVEKRLDAVDVILVSDYLKGVLTEQVLRGVIDLGRRGGIPVVVDPKGTDYRKYMGASLLTPNRKEAQAASGRSLQKMEEILEVGRSLRRELDLEALVITLGDEGMVLFPAAGGETHLRTEAREVYDVSGAGDTVLALLGAGMALGLQLEEGAAIANLAAGAVVGKVGTSTVTPPEILAAALRSEPIGDLKILDRYSLRQALERERSAGRRIVFTNGCFDLLHVGHVRYLQQARALGDLLVLGLNSDASIRRLKGEKRPLIGEEERAHILAALHCVDYVTVFDEDTPLELIGLLKPQILVKGGDYTPEIVVGRELVEGWGGRVEIVPFVDGRSTSGLIDRILKAYQD